MRVQHILSEARAKEGRAKGGMHRVVAAMPVAAILRAVSTALFVWHGHAIVIC
jgi:hypothetical protein